MKKSLLLFTILFLGYKIVLAQTAPQKPADKKGLKRLNVSVGTTFSNFISSEDSHLIYAHDYSSGYYVISDYDTDTFEDIKTGFAFSLGFEYFLKNNVSLNMGLSYEERGIDLSVNKKEVNKRGVKSTIRHTLDVSNHYLILPISLRHYFKNNKFYLQGGIYTGWLLDSDVKIYDYHLFTYPNSDYSIYESTFDGKGQDYTKDFDFGLLFGLGFSQKISKNLFFNADIMMSFGLLNIDDKVSILNSNRFSENFRFPFYKYHGLANVKNIACKVSVGVAYQF